MDVAMKWNVTSLLSPTLRKVFRLVYFTALGVLGVAFLVLVALFILRETRPDVLEKIAVLERLVNSTTLFLAASAGAGLWSFGGLYFLVRRFSRVPEDRKTPTSLFL